MTKKKITERLARLEAAAGSGCEECNNPTDIERGTARRIRQRMADASTPAYHRRLAGELDAEAARREKAQADPGATGPPWPAVPAGQGDARRAGTDRAVRVLCPECQAAADLGDRVVANRAAAERARTPGDLRREAREALAEAERLERQAEASGSNS